MNEKNRPSIIEESTNVGGIKLKWEVWQLTDAMCKSYFKPVAPDIFLRVRAVQVSDAVAETLRPYVAYRQYREDLNNDQPEKKGQLELEQIALTVVPENLREKYIELRMLDLRQKQQLGNPLKEQNRVSKFIWTQFYLERFKRIMGTDPNKSAEWDDEVEKIVRVGLHQVQDFQKVKVHEVFDFKTKERLIKENTFEIYLILKKLGAEKEARDILEPLNSGNNFDSKRARKTVENAERLAEKAEQSVQEARKPIERRTAKKKEPDSTEVFDPEKARELLQRTDELIATL